MPTLDFITALGRLLRDGTLRDAFAFNPSLVADQLGVGESDRDAFLKLPPADLEFQARVLIQKRFKSVQRLLPLTCARLGKEAWPCFHEYARRHGSESPDGEVADARDFTQSLVEKLPAAIARSEFNRFRFAAEGRWCALHYLSEGGLGSRSKSAVQALFRWGRSAGWHELIFYLKL